MADVHPDDLKSTIIYTYECIWDALESLPSSAENEQNLLETDKLNPEFSRKLDLKREKDKILYRLNKAEELLKDLIQDLKIEDKFYTDIYRIRKADKQDLGHF